MKINKLKSKIENNNLKILEYEEKIKLIEEDNLKLRNQIKKEEEKEILNIIKNANISVKDLTDLILNKNTLCIQDAQENYKNERSF